MNKFIPFLIATALVLSACGVQQKHNKNDASAAIMAAQQANKQAKKVEFEWRNTGKIIKKAKKAAKSGEFDKAVKLADKAKKQAQMAMLQYKASKKVRPRI